MTENMKRLVKEYAWSTKIYGFNSKEAEFALDAIDDEIKYEICRNTEKLLSF